MAEMTPADVLEEAADLMLIRGRLRGSFGYDPGGPRCTLGAIGEVVGLTKFSVLDSQHTEAAAALQAKVGCVAWWNDTTRDDFTVIDTLRLVAKDIRNAAGPS